jgi:hypothetical protein
MLKTLLVSLLSGVAVPCQPSQKFCSHCSAMWHCHVSIKIVQPPLVAERVVNLNRTSGVVGDDPRPCDLVAATTRLGGPDYPYVVVEGEGGGGGGGGWIFGQTWLEVEKR